MKYLILLAAFGLIFLSGSASAGEKPDFMIREEAAIGALARLNAEALICKDVEAVRSIKKAIIYGVPKLRDYGDFFEEKTSEFFLEISKTKLQCPTPDARRAQVDKAVADLDAAFGENRK